MPRRYTSGKIGIAVVEGPSPTVETSPNTADLILTAARRAIAERGPEKLTVSAVAAAAGVSRPTVYRWFPTKALLLAAITAYEVEQFDVGLRAVADAHRDPADRLDAAVRYLVTYLDPLGADPIGVDPAFALQSLADSLASHVASIAHLLDDALDEIPGVRCGALSREEAVEVLLRLAYSHYVVPSADADELVATVRAFAGLPRAQRPVRTVRSRIPRVARNADSGTIGKRSLMSSPTSDQS
jgi:AcrR family transcriptional regulator